MLKLCCQLFDVIRVAAQKLAQLLFGASAIEDVPDLLGGLVEFEPDLFWDTRPRLSSTMSRP
jgi:hypothetical protein